MIIQNAVAQGLTSNLQKNSTKLNEEQTAKVAELLSNLDPSALKSANLQEIVTEAKELRLIRNSDLAAALADAGIDASELLKQSGVDLNAKEDAPEAPLPPQETKGIATVDEAVVELINQAVEAHDISQEEDVTLGEAVLAALEEAGYDSSQPLIDFYA